VSRSGVLKSARCGFRWGECAERSAKHGPRATPAGDNLEGLDFQSSSTYRVLPLLTYDAATRPHLCLLSHDAHPRRLGGAHRCSGCELIYRGQATLPISRRSSRPRSTLDQP
jgi:hypothetical protein